MTGVGVRGPAAGGVAIPVVIRHPAATAAMPGRREPAHVHRFTSVCPQFYRRLPAHATLPAGGAARRRAGPPPRRRVYSGPTVMTPQPEDVPRVLDTRGDEPFAATYVAVIVVEALVLAALWLFSRHFSG